MKDKKRIVDGEREGWYWARRSKPSYRILPQTTVWKQEMPRHVGAFDPQTSADQSKMKTSIISI